MEIISHLRWEKELLIFLSEKDLSYSFCGYSQHILLRALFHISVIIHLCPQFVNKVQFLC